MPDVEVSASDLERLSALIGRRTHLRIAATGREALTALAERRMAELGLDLDGYLTALAESPPNAGELESVTRELTVGESYFFRDPAQIDVLYKHIIPELVKKRSPLGELRVLSAGCASGEEPYTLAIALSECLPRSAEWRVTITALDINTEFLRRAGAASYSEWSLRQAPERIKQRYFAREGSRYQLSPEIRSRVRFHYANLAVDPLPAPALGVIGMDLIFCRNVLYYFEHDARGRVIEGLARSLALGGFLVFGHSDLVKPQVPLCRTVSFNDVVVFQRADRTLVASPPDSAPRTPSAFEPVAAVATPSEPVSEPAAFRDLAPVFELANAGEFREAIAALDGVIRAHPELAAGHLLHAFLLAEQSEHAAALDAFRRCLYLDPSLLLAHAGASMAARRLGNTALARRHAACVRALAKDQPEQSPVMGWEGMSAGRLMRLFSEQVAED